LIRELFGDSILGYIPLYPEDVVGVKAVEAVIRDLEVFKP
jgi:hypothetical protein